MADPTADLARLLRLEVDPTDLHERLRIVIDPELGINIVDLGLVYGVEVFGGVARVPRRRLVRGGASRLRHRVRLGFPGAAALARGGAADHPGDAARVAIRGHLRDHLQVESNHRFLHGR
jgi:hypothetical protein